MRIISGSLKGLKFNTYHGDNTRPTTDLAKQGIFNTLDAIVEFKDLKVIDLFAGTGNIGLEFLSRGAHSVHSVDHHVKNIRYMQEIKRNYSIEQWHIHKQDVITFLKEEHIKADLIFADPPYDYPQMHDLVNLVLALDWFQTSKAILVLEHVDRLVFNQKELFLKKQYGDTSFSCFRHIYE
jgi:16S rRNA (guanine966-N2)-methyltransferase